MRPWYFVGAVAALAVFVVAVMGTGARPIAWFLSVPSFIVVVLPPLANLGGDASVIGSGTAVSLLTVVYAVLIEILIPVPFRLALRQRLARIDGEPV